MKFGLVTIFPEFFDSALRVGVLERAIEAGLVSIELANPRDFTQDKHRTVDDASFGGGAGMVMKPEPLAAAIRDLRSRVPEAKVLALSPGGRRLSDQLAKQLAREKGLILLCGRYEGIDQRVLDHFCDGEISLGNFVLSGGEPAALCVIDAVARQVPGVVGKQENIETESFCRGLKYPVYTRPAVFEEFSVPEVLLSGDERLIERWRNKASVERTARNHPESVVEAAWHKIVLEFRNFPFSEAAALTKPFLLSHCAFAVFLSGDSGERESFRGLFEGRTLSARTRREADAKILRAVGEFEWLTFPADPDAAPATREKAASLFRKDRAVVFHLDGDVAGRENDRVVSFALALKELFQSP